MKPRQFATQVFITIICIGALSRSSTAPAQTTTAPDDLQKQRIVTDPAEIAGVTLPVVKSGPALGKRDPKLEVVALAYGCPPAGIVLGGDGRMFVSFPRWGDRVDYSCVQVYNGQPAAFPDVKSHRDKDHKDRLVSVQGMDLDDHGRLWLLDTSNARLRAYNPRSREILLRISLSTDVTKGGIYPNDVRISTRAGAGGYAFISDSVGGGIVVIDLAEGASWRRLKEHPFSRAAEDFIASVEGKPLVHEVAKGEGRPMRGNTDGIALSPDGKVLYYAPFSDRSLYSVPTAALVDRTTSEDQVAASVKKLATKPSANDGMCTDGEGRVYTTDYEDSAIRRWSPGADQFELVVQDERICWPDAVAVHERYLYLTTNQLNRMASLHLGKDQRQQPFAIFRYPL